MPVCVSCQFFRGDTTCCFDGAYPSTTVRQPLEVHLHVHVHRAAIACSCKGAACCVLLLLETLNRPQNIIPCKACDLTSSGACFRCCCCSPSPSILGLRQLLGLRVHDARVCRSNSGRPPFRAHSSAQPPPPARQPQAHAHLHAVR